MRKLNSARMKEIRVNLGLDQTEVTKLSGVSDTVISRLENGRVDNPLPKTLEKLAKAYGCDVDDFYVEIREVLPHLVERELKKHLQAIKRLLAGGEGELTEFNVEMRLTGSTYRAVRHCGNIND